MLRVTLLPSSSDAVTRQSCTRHAECGTSSPCNSTAACPPARCSAGCAALNPPCRVWNTLRGHKLQAQPTCTLFSRLVASGLFSASAAVVGGRAWGRMSRRTSQLTQGEPYGRAIAKWFQPWLRQRGGGAGMTSRQGWHAMAAGGARPMQQPAPVRPRSTKARGMETHGNRRPHRRTRRAGQQAAEQVLGLGIVGIVQVGGVLHPQCELGASSESVGSQFRVS